ncbi:MAG: sigma-70 family RNA polymerase sigma factor [Oscillibacter sp.]|uniref:RNA polymerase sigma factor n=1 Tax=Oscillibacter sp. TaxID=1945593 RepID=UPI001327716B|nr:sigma-70 family RNA polymerase sigma factor [Oscillibacter sp.]MUU10001.1 sigma-70 family RNA polymerase sigma factor [Oscillibacter sp.]
MHQSFVKLAEHMVTIPDGPCPRTRNLVVTVAERKAIDLYRSRQRHPETELDEQTVWSAPPEGGGLADAMASLPPQEVLLLKYYNGYSAREIAGFLSATPDAVTQTLHRARKKLAEILDERGDAMMISEEALYAAAGGGEIPSALPDREDCVHDSPRTSRPGWRRCSAVSGDGGTGGPCWRPPCWSPGGGTLRGGGDRTDCQIYWSQTDGELRYVIRLEHATTRPFQDAQLRCVPEGFILVRSSTSRIRGERGAEGEDASFTLMQTQETWWVPRGPPARALRWRSTAAWACWWKRRRTAQKKTCCGRTGPTPRPPWEGPVRRRAAGDCQECDLVTGKEESDETQLHSLYRGHEHHAAVGRAGGGLPGGETRPLPSERDAERTGGLRRGQVWLCSARNRYLPALPGLRRTERRSPLC